MAAKEMFGRRQVILGVLLLALLILAGVSVFAVGRVSSLAGDDPFRVCVDQALSGVEGCLLGGDEARCKSQTVRALENCRKRRPFAGELFANLGQSGVVVVLAFIALVAGAVLWARKK